MRFVCVSARFPAWSLRAAWTGFRQRRGCTTFAGDSVRLLGVFLRPVVPASARSAAAAPCAVCSLASPALFPARPPRRAVASGFAAVARFASCACAVPRLPRLSRSRRVLAPVLAACLPPASFLPAAARWCPGWSPAGRSRPARAGLRLRRAAAPAALRASAVSLARLFSRRRSVASAPGFHLRLRLVAPLSFLTVRCLSATSARALRPRYRCCYVPCAPSRTDVTFESSPRAGRPTASFSPLRCCRLSRLPPARPDRSMRRSTSWNKATTLSTASARKHNLAAIL